MRAGRSGPSAGKGLEHTMLPEMLDHIIRTFFPHFWKAPSGSLREVRHCSAHAMGQTDVHRGMMLLHRSCLTGQGSPPSMQRPVRGPDDAKLASWPTWHLQAQDKIVFCLCRMQTPGRTCTWSSMRRCASAQLSWWQAGSASASVTVSEHHVHSWSKVGL